MSLLSPRMLKTMRRTMNKFMIDEVEVYRIGDQSESIFDPDTITSTPKDGTMIYDGVARLRPTSGPREIAVGESVMVLRDADFSFPWDAPEFQRDDMIFHKGYITGLFDENFTEPFAVNATARWFRVTDVTLAGQQATKRCSALQIQPSRVWKTS